MEIPYNVPELTTWPHSRKNTQHTFPEIRYNLDIVRFIQRMRMHGVALRMMMNEDVMKVSGWFGYKRHIKYAQEQIGNEKEVEENEDFWDLAEEVGPKERKLYDTVKKIMKIDADNQEEDKKDEENEEDEENVIDA